MSYNQEKAKELVLALMYLGRHEHVRTWKGFDWDVMDQLHQAGLISNPKSRAKSVVLTEEGLAQSEAMFKKYLTPPA
jgi:hypothetical protein